MIYLNIANAQMSKTQSDRATPISKPGAAPSDLPAVVQKTSSSEGATKAGKPTEHGAIGKAAEIMKEVTTRYVLEVGKIAVEPPHDPITATIAAGGLMMSAIGTSGGIAGAVQENPLVQKLKATGTIGSVAATVAEAALGTGAIGLGGALAAGRVGLGAFELTSSAIKGTWLGGGAGEQLANVWERYRNASPITVSPSISAWSGELRHSGIGY
jgi:hypothetical protein